jgi:hypothetical protein
MQSILNSAGIPCEVRNDTVSQVMIGFPFVPELWILRDEDYEEAAALVSEFKREMPPYGETEPTTTAPPGMALKQFRTNMRLWLLASLVLFVPPWFIMEIGTGSGDIKHPIQLWFILFGSHGNSGSVISRIIACTLLFGISALIIGWVLQCLITMIRVVVRERKRDTA